METNILTDIFLPVALAIIMLGMGLSLHSDDFRRVFLYPKAATLGVFNQLVLLPVVAFFIAYFLLNKPEYAVGLMILAVCPGGVTSNLISHLSKGDTALSISLTAVSGMVTIFTIPFIVKLSIWFFMSEGQTVELSILRMIGQIFFITLIPVSIGMAIRAKRPLFALKMNQPVKYISAVFLLLVILAAVLNDRENLLPSLQQVGLATFLLNAGTMSLGFITGKIFRLHKPQCISISIESGIQNGTLAIVIAATLLQNPEMALPPAIYSLIMFFTGGFMIWYYGRK